MNSHEVWQVAVQDKVYEADLEEMIQWIKEGSVMPEDKVRRGNLRWLDAGKIPELKIHFQNGFAENEVNVSSTQLAENAPVYTHFQTGQENSEIKTQVSALAAHNIHATGGIHVTMSGQIESKACSVHADRDYEYVCEICGCFFCKDCPNTFGSNVKICLSCGGLCVERQEFELRGNKIVGSINKPYPRVETQVADDAHAADSKLRAADFVEALKLPLRHPLNYILCVAFFALLIVGQTFLAVGGTTLLAISAAMTVLILILKFSVMFKTIENSLQDKPKLSFLPRLNRFTFWEDFIYPLFIGAAVYAVTFFLFFALTLGAGIYAYATYSDTMDKVKIEAAQTQKSVETTLTSAQANPPSAENGEFNALGAAKTAQEHTLETDFTDFFGNDYLADMTQPERVVASFMRLSVYFHMPVFFALLLGVLLFPAVCAVAGSTRSVFGTFDLSLAVKAIKAFGFDYVKIVSLSVITAVATFSIAAGIYQIFSIFDSRLIGLLFALTASSVLFFYFWTALSYVLGEVLRKTSVLQKA